MKTFKFYYSLLLIAIAYTVGALVGLAFEFNANISGIATVIGFAFAHRPAGVASDGLDLTEVAADVKNYIRTYATAIWAKIMTGVDFEQYMRPVPGQTGTYVATTSRRTNFVQGYQHGFTPAGGVSFHPNSTEVRRMKVDILFDNMDELVGTYLGEKLIAEGKGLQFQPFVPWFVEMHLIPGIIEDIRRISVIGEYVAPTPGTPTTPLESADGIFTIITNAIAASKLENIIVTGAITSVNVLDKIIAYHRGLPEEYRGLPGNVFCSYDILEDYKYAFAEEHRADTNYEGFTAKIFGTQKQLVGLPALNGSDRLLYTPQGNMVKLFDKLVMPNFEFQVVDRNLKMLGDMHRSWGFDTFDNVFVNDAA